VTLHQWVFRSDVSRHNNVLIHKGCNVAYNSVRNRGKISDDRDKKKILKRYVRACLKRNLVLLALELIKADKKPLSLFDEGCRKLQVARQQNFKNDGRIETEPYSYPLVLTGKQEAGAGGFKNRQPVDILS